MKTPEEMHRELRREYDAAMEKIRADYEARNRALDRRLFWQMGLLFGIPVVITLAIILTHWWRTQ